MTALTILSLMLFMACYTTRCFAFAPMQEIPKGDWYRSPNSLTVRLNRVEKSFWPSKTVGSAVDRSQLSRHNRGTQVSMSTISTVASAAAVAGVIAFHEAGHLLAAKWQGMKVQSYNIGYGPKLFSFNDSDSTEFALRAFPLGGYVGFPINQEYDPETGEVIRELDDPDLLQNRPPLQRAWVIAGGVLANVLLTFLLSTGAAVTTGISAPQYDDGIVVTSVSDISAPAYKAGIREKDVIIKLDNKPVLGSETTVENFVSTVRRNQDVPLDVEIIRTIDSPATKTKTAAAATASTTSAATATAESGLQKKQVIHTTVTPAVNSKGKVSIGLGINAVVEQVKTSKAKNPIEAISLGFDQTTRLISFTWNAFVRAVSSGFVGNELGGPISVVTAGAQVAEYSPTALIGFIASLSVNLAVLNALPIPALDGGQMVFVLIELLTQRAIPRKIQDTITGVAFSGLFLFGISTIVGDIERLNDPKAPIVTQVKTSSSMPGERAPDAGTR